MEEQKKKYLLSKIKKEELIINNQYAQFKSTYQHKLLTEERTQPYLELISHLVELNHSFAAQLIEYLEPTQIKAIFERGDTLFSDLLNKYKQTHDKLLHLEESHKLPQSKNLCQICHEQIENNKIQIIKQQIDKQSEARSVLIKNLIEQTEKERVRPLFTQEEDFRFKQQLQKVLKQKQLAIETNISESTLFLQKISTEIATFMLQFKKDFGSWEVGPVQQGVNWPNMMKNYVNKKLSSSFQEKLPTWIKKMHGMFVENQPKKPKIYYCSKQIQTTEITSPGELKARKQIEQLKKELLGKGEEVAKVQFILQKTKEINNELKDKIRDQGKQIQMLENELIEKLQIKESTNHSYYEREHKEKEKEAQPTIKDINTSQIIDSKPSQQSLGRNKKISKMLAGEFTHQRINTQSVAESNYTRNQITQDIEIEQQEEKNSNDARMSLMLEQNQQENTSPLNINNQSTKFSSSKQELITKNESSRKLKKKVYRGDNREDIIKSKTETVKQPQQKQGASIAQTSKASPQFKENNDPKKQEETLEKRTDQINYPQKLQIKKIIKEHSIPKLKDEVKQVEASLKNSRQSNCNINPIANAIPQKRYNSISVFKQNKDKKSSISGNYKNIPSLKSQKLQTCETAVQTEHISHHSYTHSKSSSISNDKKITFHEPEQATRKHHLKNLVKIKEHLEKIIEKDQTPQSKELEKLNKVIEEYTNEIIIAQKEEETRLLPPVDSKQATEFITAIKSDNNSQYKLKEVKHKGKYNRPIEVHNKSLAQSEHFEIDQRKNKSLCIPKGKGSKENKIKLPKISMYHDISSNQISQKSSRVNSEVNDQFYTLFLTDQQAQRYEESFYQSSNRKEREKPTPHQFKLIEEMFAQIEALKKDKRSLYTQIGSLLRYPLTELKNNFIEANLVHSVDFQDFVNYFLKILWIHRHCPKNQFSLCAHMDVFSKKLRDLARQKYV